MQANHRVLGFGLATIGSLLGAGCSSSADADRGQIPAGATIEEAREIQPNAAVHIAAGDLAMGQGSPNDAMTQYGRALELEPRNRDALYKLAAVQTYTRQFDRAIPTWQRYVAATDESGSALSNLGRAYELSGDWKQAEVSYLDALKREPGNRAARVNYGILLAKRDRTDEAEQQLGKALVPAEVQYNLGSVCELRKDFAGAKQRYERALSFDPQFAAARQRLDLLPGVSSVE